MESSPSHRNNVLSWQVKYTLRTGRRADQSRSEESGYRNQERMRTAPWGYQQCSIGQSRHSVKWHLNRNRKRASSRTAMASAQDGPVKMQSRQSLDRSHSYLN